MPDPCGNRRSDHTRRFDSSTHVIIPVLSANRKRVSGNCASDRFPSKGCKDAHYPHTCAAHKAGIYRCVGPGMDDRPSVATRQTENQNTGNSEVLGSSILVGALNGVHRQPGA